MGDPLTKYFAPLGRLLLSGIFLVSGIGKIMAYQGTQAYMESKGVPGALLPLVIATEIILPLAIIIGVFARPAAFLLAGFTLVAALLFHSNISDQIQFIMFLKNVAIAGGLLLLVATGPGTLSLQKTE